MINLDDYELKKMSVEVLAYKAAGVVVEGGVPKIGR